MLTIATDDRPLTTSEASKVLGMSKSWLESGRSMGYGPKFVRVGGRVLYRRSDLEAYLASR